jgi:hypothetical protein
MTSVRVGLFPPVDQQSGDSKPLPSLALSRGVDHLCVGDHVSCFVGAGSPHRDPSAFERALNVWCGFGPTREAARGPLAARMQGFYQMPFEPFERYCALRQRRRHRGIPEPVHRCRLRSVQRDPVRRG